METKPTLDRQEFTFKLNRDIAFAIDESNSVESLLKTQITEGEKKLNIDFSLYDRIIQIGEDSDDFIHNKYTIVVQYKPKKEPIVGNYKDFLNI